ncbi:Rad52/Rad22 family DNA repair protein [Spirosoma fluviale]|uniref:Rad52/22 family double-strand break repair protein n=1 Tax=Spirosoma fluviale TaxID=1597977 RepID=A0A286FCY2_9BACT|nr:Rad52/Rad22 family DNA repair protein [Spirosoma fluviale]SOD81101.1 Rad52/22 family double-strand break repair protein [Spirosoma fluviale]
MANTLTEEQILLLQKPLPDAAISPHPTKKNMSSIRPIYVVERLNEVFGVGQWSLKTDLLPVNGNGDTILTINKITSTNKERTEYSCIVKTILTIPEYGIYYECIAGSTNDDMGDAAKGGISDGLSKICSWLGIGMAVYKGEQDKANQQWLKLIRPNVQQAINDLLDCESTQDLAVLKDQLYSVVLENKEFITAARERYAQLIALEEAAQSTPVKPKMLPEGKAENLPQSEETLASAEVEQAPAPLLAEPIKPGSLGPNIPDGKGGFVNVGKYITEANDAPKVMGTVRWLRMKQRDGYNVKAWMDAIHEKAITQLGLIPVTDPDTKLVTYCETQAA